jgi:hypothetical protein
MFRTASEMRVINKGKEKAEVVQKKNKSESCLGFQVLTSITC